MLQIVHDDENVRESSGSVIIKEVRVWLADPRYLSRAHLLGAHNELHSLIRTVSGESTGWKNHPETLRFSEAENGLDWLFLMHELTRVAMSTRWPGRHQHDHRSPVAEHSHPLELTLYEKMAANRDYVFPPRMSERKARPRDFRRWLLDAGFPPTRLEHDTPWERDAVPFEWYRQHEDDWTHELVNAYHGDTPREGLRYHGSKIR